MAIQHSQQRADDLKLYATAEAASVQYRHADILLKTGWASPSVISSADHLVFKQTIVKPWRLVA